MEKDEAIRLLIESVEICGIYDCFYLGDMPGEIVEYLSDKDWALIRSFNSSAYALNRRIDQIARENGL